MKTLTIATIVLAVGFAAGIGCGSDTGGKTDAPVIGGGTGGAVRMDGGGAGGAIGTGGVTGAGGVPGSGGAMVPDAPLATGGTGGGHDGGAVDVGVGLDGGAPDTPLVGIDGGSSEAGTVPQCAMKVQIDKDGGNFSPYTPPVSCGCFFEMAVTKATTAPAGCVACTSDNQCSGGKRCQTGYCE